MAWTRKWHRRCESPPRADRPDHTGHIGPFLASYRPKSQGGITAMKRSCLTIGEDFTFGSQAVAISAPPAIGWTMMFAVTLAVMVFGMIWYG